MRKQFMIDQKIDHKFKAALEQSMENQLAKLPAEDCLATIEFSPAFERKMDRLIRAQRRPYSSMINTVGKRVAVVATVTVVALTAAVFSVKPLREPVAHFFADVYDQVSHGISRVFFQKEEEPSQITDDSQGNFNIYIKEKEGESDEYNAAIRAYNQFLRGEIDAEDATEDPQPGRTFDLFSVFFRMSEEEHEGRFALFDVNHDGIPELLTDSIVLSVLSYQNGHLVCWYQYGSWMNGPTYALDNGAIFSKHFSTGTMYTYTTFDSNGASTLRFREYEELNDYYFDGKDVSKDEYEKLTKEIFELSEKEANTEWTDYSIIREYRKQHGLTY